MSKVLVENDDGTIVLKIDPAGLVSSFLQSVNNDTMWQPVLEVSTKKCFDQYDGANEGLHCSGCLFDFFVADSSQHFNFQLFLSNFIL